MSGRSLFGALLMLASCIATLVAGEIPRAERRSGFDFMSPETQAMQRDDTANPGMLYVGDGEALWGTRAGAADRACADCHGDARASMRGVAAGFPRFAETEQRPVDLAQQINLCRSERQQAAPLRAESRDLLSLTAFVAHQSRGLPVSPPEDTRLTPYREAGRTLYNQRLGQMNFSCANCHDDHWGKRLGGSVIPQAYGTGYPVYRLEWQTLGSLQRRLRNCLSGVRAEPFPFGAVELVNLELYLAERAAGMAIETPGVRP